MLPVTTYFIAVQISHDFFFIYHVCHWEFGLHKRFYYYELCCHDHLVVQKFLLRTVRQGKQIICDNKLTPRHRWLNTTKVDFFVGESQGPRPTEAT